MSKFADLRGTSNGSFQLGVGGPILKASGSRIQARTSSDGAATTFESSDLILNGKRRTISATEPISRAEGDQWLELISTGEVPKYNWDWTWNGTYWLAPQKEWTPDSFNIITTNTDLYFLVDPNFNYYLNSWRSGTFVASPNSAASHWTLTVGRRNSANTTTSITTQSTSGNAPDVWVRTSAIALNEHIHVASTGAIVFSVRLAKAGTTALPGGIYLAATLTYQLARL